MTPDYEFVPNVGLANYTIFVDSGRVNIEDLLRSKPGGVVRVNGNPHDCVMVVADERESFSYVAGMISENP